MMFEVSAYSPTFSLTRRWIANPEYSNGGFWSCSLIIRDKAPDRSSINLKWYPDDLPTEDIRMARETFIDPEYEPSLINDDPILAEIAAADDIADAVDADDLMPF